MWPNASAELGIALQSADDVRPETNLNPRASSDGNSAAYTRGVDLAFKHAMYERAMHLRMSVAWVAIESPIAYSNGPSGKRAISFPAAKPASWYSRSH